jgi:Fe-Mn family superoxide dismutase
MTTRRTVLALAASAVALPAQSVATPFSLPKLPYALDALEPYIDARTMEIHHGKHHQTYVDNLNKALASHPDLAQQPLEQLLRNGNTLPESIRNVVRNNGGGHANHALFWQILGLPSGSPKGKLAQAITKTFSSKATLEEKLRAAGLGVFGSGWVWLNPGPAGTLVIDTSPNQDNPWMSGLTPILGIDVWEHAYYLKYQNRRADYLTAVLQVINWDFVSQRYEQILASR